MSLQHWDTVKQEVIFEHPRLTLIEDTVLLPDGNETTYLRFKRNGDAASIIAVGDDGRILLQREYSHPPGKILYQFPGGGVPNGEEPAMGANRELMEEAGFRGDLEEIGEYYLDNRRTEAKMHVFVARNLKELSLEKDAEEFLEHEWFTVAEVTAMIRRGEIENGHLLAAWTLFIARRSD